MPMPIPDTDTDADADPDPQSSAREWSAVQTMHDSRRGPPARTDAIGVGIGIDSQRTGFLEALGLLAHLLESESEPSAGRTLRQAKPPDGIRSRQGEREVLPVPCLEAFRRFGHGCEQRPSQQQPGDSWPREPQKPPRYTFTSSASRKRKSSRCMSEQAATGNPSLTASHTESLTQSLTRTRGGLRSAAVSH
jgi:hypothetical protein